MLFPRIQGHEQSIFGFGRMLRTWSIGILTASVLLGLLALNLSCGGGGSGGGESSGNDNEPQSGAPVITTHPESQTVMAGDNATFIVAASGNPAPAITWEKSTNGTTWTPIGGAAGAMYSFTATTGDNGARFRVKAANSVNTAFSSAATLTVVDTNMSAAITQYGITWTFDKAYEVGRFVNGDWWVKGPVTVASVAPAPSSGRNGSVVNPGIGVQGYDDRGGAYNASVRAIFPLPMNPVQSLVSTISNPNVTDCLRYGQTPGWTNYRGECLFTGPMKTQAILTCVADIPAAETFRPPYAGSGYKPLYAAADIKWDLLPRLPASASAPNGDEVIRNFERPWLDHYKSWIIEHTFAIDNMYGYGRELSNIVSEGAQYVMLDSTVTETLAIRLIQLGIDNYGVLKAGGAWKADGGHHQGRKWPILFAGLMLDDSDMKNVGHDYDGTITFGEDGHTYYGVNGAALWGKACNGEGTYFQNGCTGAGSKDCRDPAGLVDGCPDYRLCCTSHTWVGQMLAALMMGAKDLWNHEAYFDYVDRWIAEGGGFGGRDNGSFIGDMWATYRDNLPVSSLRMPGVIQKADDKMAVHPNEKAVSSIYFNFTKVKTGLRSVTLDRERRGQIFTLDKFGR